MTNLLKKPLFHILLPIILAIILNGIIYYFKWNKSSLKMQHTILPPGYVIAIVWIIIFGLLGYSHYLLYKLNNKYTIYNAAILLFLVFSLAYPFLTYGLKGKNANILNLITLILAFVISLMVITQSLMAFYYIIPLLVWATYVNISDSLICNSSSINYTTTTTTKSIRS
jgi:tryptophan-rich sensory protein